MREPPLHFRFFGLGSKDGQVVARIREIEGYFPFAATADYTKDELELHNLILVFDKHQRWRKAESRKALVNAFVAIRDAKLKSGIDFDIPEDVKL